MKNSLLFLALLIITSFNLFGQAKLPEFGEPNLDELKMSYCSFEENADALTILKTATIKFTTNAFSEATVMNTEHRVRKKIFNKRGFSAANIKIPYIHESHITKITDLEAYVYSLSPDGKMSKRKLGKKEILNTKTNSEVRFIAFTFSNLQPGDVIEYRYTELNKNLLSIPAWFFQDENPTQFSKVEATTPYYMQMQFHIKASNFVKKDSSSKKYNNWQYNTESYSFTEENIHSFREEPLMTSIKDNTERVEFSVIPTFSLAFLNRDNFFKWNLLNSFLMEERHFGGQFNRELNGTKAFIDSVKKIDLVTERMAAVYNYVKSNIEWTGEQTYYCDSVEKCWNEKLGSSAEMNLILFNLLTKAEVKCFPVLISTRQNGNPDIDFASMSQFNGVDVLAKDSNRNYVLDCTQKYLSYDLPPYNILNSNVLIVDWQLHDWYFYVDPRVLLKNKLSADIHMDTAGMIKGTSNILFYGFAKSEFMHELNNPKDSKEMEEENSEENVAALIFDSTKVITTPNDVDSLTQISQFHFMPSNTGPIYFLNPLMFSTFKKNPFRDSTRYTDIDFGCSQSMETNIRLTVARNFSIEEIPKNISIQNDDSAISFERTIVKKQNELTIHIGFLLKNANYSKEDYHSIKSFFDRIYSIMNEEISLKKMSDSKASR